MSEKRVFFSVAEQSAYNLGISDALSILNGWIEAVEMTDGDYLKVYAMKLVRDQIITLAVNK